MSAPRRRSSRLRGSNATPGKSFNHASMHLSSLTERDETPTHGAQSNLDCIVSSPLAPRTPATGCAKPPLEEMHPSKAHQSTTKEPDSGLRLGFVGIEKNGENMPSGVTQQTPSKTGISSSFDFQFARPGPQLGPAAQKMMDDLREEALRIKAKLAAEREEESRLDDESNVTGRKIAQPKGKVGRYSDVHMAEFKKMDSIAGHASSFRAQPGRFTPATKPSLKRSQSKAKLDDREEVESCRNDHRTEGFQATALPKPNLKRSQSKARLDDREDSDNDQNGKILSFTERLENTAPAKRARQNMADDTSSTRPVSRGDHTPKSMPSALPAARSQSKMLASISTPTQASLARAATTKQPATQIPTLTKSPSKPNLVGTPRGLTKSKTMSSIGSVPQSEPKNFLRSPGKFDRVRSMLRYPSSSKKAPAAPSLIPSLVRSPSKPNLEKTLPPIPTTPGLDRSKSVKHVNFTPDTINKNSATISKSPSPFKSAIPRSPSKFNVAAKAQPTDQASDTPAPARDVHYPSIAGLPKLPNDSQSVDYPSLDGVRPLPEPPHQASSKHGISTSVAGTFSFRTDHTIQFGESPKGFGSSPGQSSVRQVRQSILPTRMPGAFPVSNGSNKENKAPNVHLPSVAHGMSNKKRCRADSDDEEEKGVEGSPAKKRKANVPEGEMLMAPMLLAEKAAAASKLPSPTKKKVLSLSRLNMLSRPKNRK
ncbi:hypothetical protein D0Z07_1334 [Hyphodiscus hymeniophilus]|uniref:Erythromycin esterase n=1 Tax=Hyphodiscus hymeniophilus TaxID=353542 RepID=A0A9P6VPK4_9HELO|nr:hypothetical protein D0Z07_1334 [Hyphodiscus hymeniophilus]